MDNDLRSNLDKLHTTDMGVDRIKRNLQIDVADVVKYCYNFIIKEDAVMERKGKNWYIFSNQIEITVNAYSYTIITAHKERQWRKGTMNDLIAYCGLNCEKCDARLATVNNDNALREKTAQLWSEMNDAPITADMIHCMGCRVEGVKTPYCDSMCEIRQCAMKKGLDTCGSCSDMENCKEVGAVLSNSSDALDNLKS